MSYTYKDNTREDLNGCNTFTDNSDIVAEKMEEGRLNGDIQKSRR